MNLFEIPPLEPIDVRLPNPSGRALCLVVLIAATLPLLVAWRATPAPAPASADWPGFRGPNGAGVADGAALPSSWDLSSGEHVLWSAEIPGLAHSSPIVLGARVYLTTAVAEGMRSDLTLGDVEVAGIAVAEDRVSHRWNLIALDAASGEILWSREAVAGEPRTGRHVKASHASQTPASNGEVIVALFGSEGLFAFDMDGEPLWQVDLGNMNPGLWGDPDYPWGPASSPVIWEDLVIVQNDRQAGSFLAAYDLRTGEQRWQTDRDEKPAWSTPVIWQGEHTELITNGANYIRGYDPATGEELWRLSHGDIEVITPSPVVAGDTVVVTGGYPPGGNPIVALRPGGEGELEPEPGSDHVQWQVQPGSPYTPTPVIYRGRVHVIADNGIFSVYDLATGERVHRARMAVGAGFSASPLASDGRLFFASEDGDVFVLSADSYEELARIDMGEPLMATPAIAGNTLFIRGSERIWAVSASD